MPILSYYDARGRSVVGAHNLNLGFLGGAMTRKRTIGSMAAAAGLAVSVAWLTAAPAARADELSDMRADMQLLQQRMDQLAQFAPGTTGGAAYGTKAAQ